MQQLRHALSRLNPLSMGLPISQIRNDFPILQQQVYEKPLVYMDNGATTHKPRAVIHTASAEGAVTAVETATGFGDGLLPSKSPVHFFEGEGGHLFNCFLSLLFFMGIHIKNFIKGNHMRSDITCIFIDNDTVVAINTDLTAIYASALSP